MSLRLLEIGIESGIFLRASMAALCSGVSIACFNFLLALKLAFKAELISAGSRTATTNGSLSQLDFG